MAWQEWSDVVHPTARLLGGQRSTNSCCDVSGMALHFTSRSVTDRASSCSFPVKLHSCVSRSSQEDISPASACTTLNYFFGGDCPPGRETPRFQNSCFPGRSAVEQYAPKSHITVSNSSQETWVTDCAESGTLPYPVYSARDLIKILPGKYGVTCREMLFPGKLILMDWRGSRGFA